MSEMNEVTEVKRTKKLAKSIEGSVVTIEVAGHDALTFDFNTLPKDIRVKFGPFGLGHKLGDSAAGREGQEAIDAINKVWEGLVAGDWTTRAPAAPKLTKKALSENLSAMSDEDQAAAKALLEKLGLKL